MNSGPTIPPEVIIDQLYKHNTLLQEQLATLNSFTEELVQELKAEAHKAALNDLPFSARALKLIAEWDGAMWE